MDSSFPSRLPKTFYRVIRNRNPPSRNVGKDLHPNKVVLSAIFPDTKPTTIDVLASTWDICTFKVHSDIAPSKILPQDLVFRMETSSGKLKAVCKLEAMPREQLPDLIPEIYGIGEAFTADGERIKYTVTQYVSDTVTLESV